MLTTNAFKILEVIFRGFLKALERKKKNRSNSERQDSYDRTTVGNEGRGEWGGDHLILKHNFSFKFIPTFSQII